MEAAGRQRAAIDVDAIQEKTLSEISAVEFLTALNAGSLGAIGLHAWPEKKKVEFELDPQTLGNLRVGQVVNVITEKKKTELEKDPRPEGAVKQVGAEVMDPRSLVGNPAFINQVAREVATQLRLAR